jgi:hypothetical protein
MKILIRSLIGLFLLVPAVALAEDGVGVGGPRPRIEQSLLRPPEGPVIPPDLLRLGDELERDGERLQEGMRRAAAAARRERMDVNREAKRRVGSASPRHSGIVCTVRSLDERCHHYVQMLSSEVRRQTDSLALMPPGEARVYFEIGPAGDYKVLRMASASTEAHSMRALAIMARSHVALPHGVVLFKGFQHFAFQ